MNANKIRVSNFKFLEDLIYTSKSSAGRLTYLVKYLTHFKSYLNSESYYPEVERKSKKRIFYEQLMHILKYGEINKQYYVFGLDRKDKVSYSDYIAHQKFIHVRDKINALPSVTEHEYKLYNFLCLLRDKFVFGAFCKGVGVPSPVNIALIEAGRVQMLSQLETLPIEHLLGLKIKAFCKVFNGAQGQGVFELEIKDGMAYKNGQAISAEELQREFGKEKWLLQEKVEGQHHLLNKLYDNSVNTIRLMTVNSGSSIDTMGALLRMGTGGRRIDNWSAGGVVVPIDENTGKLTRWGYYKPGFGTKSEKHPDSGIVFEGYDVPGFQEAVQQAKYLHSLLFGIHSIGWDIAITENGPMFIEGNDNWDVALYQLVNNGKVKSSFKKIFQ